jgi:4'-phosphopantetheinyl transferase
MIQSMNIADSNFQIEAPVSLPEGEVQLWRVDVASLIGDERRWQEVLSIEEKTRAARFHSSPDRQRYTVSRAWLRIILGGYLSVDPRQLHFTYSSQEKPSLARPYLDSGITFNLSHSGGVTLVALTRNRAVGVDVEQIRRNSDVEGIARRFFSPLEQGQLAALPAEEKVPAFFRCWTRKEAYIKATGDGLSLPLDQFDVSLEKGSTKALLATRPDASEAKQWYLREVPAGAGYAAALCVRGQECRLRHWGEDSAE